MTHHPAPERVRRREVSLPQPLTSFIGREADVTTVLALLEREDVRLLTLTGPGGIGKTRLALHVAEGIAGFPDGRWFVPLAAVNDPELVLPTIAVSMGAGVGKRAPAEILAVHLADARALLVLDNFEQVLDAAPLLSGLLATCSRLKVLVTSRSRLNVSGEHVYTVPPLSVRETRSRDARDAQGASEAVRLFVDRARARQPSFALTPQSAAVIAGICRRLDGLPLGIELAAARVNILSPRDLLDRLDARLALLSDGARDQPGRLRSLRASIAWSYDLLAPGEQVVFRRLGVFAGPWTLDAAEAVVYAPDERRELNVLEGVGSLVEKSLVRHQNSSDGTSQYQPLETVREFATGLLDASDEADTVRDRLTRYLARLADKIGFAWYQPDGVVRWARLDLHGADLWAGLARAEARGDVETLICLASALPILHMHGWIGPLQDHVERAVVIGRAAGSPTLGRALISLSHFMHASGNEDLAWQHALEGVSLMEGAGDREHLIIGYKECALIAQRNDAMADAERYHRRALDAVVALRDCAWARFAESGVLADLGNNAVQRGEIAEARVWFERAVEMHIALGFEPGTGHLAASHALAGLGDVARGEGNHAAARGQFQRAITISRAAGDYRAVIYAIGGVAATLACTGQWRPAARLFGACEALHRRANIDFELETWARQRALGLPEPWFKADEPFGSGRLIRDALWGDGPPPYPPIPDPAAADALWAEGSQMSLDEAVIEALGTMIGGPEPAELTGHLLTSREIEVLRLVTEGLTDSEIAGALFISRRTAATHIRHIYDKLSVSSRASAAAWAVRNGIA